MTRNPETTTKEETPMIQTNRPAFRKRTASQLAMAAVLFAITVAAAADLQPDARGYTGPLEDRERVCMLQDTVQPKDGLEHEYDGKNYYLCCRGCLAGFQGDPDRYSHANDPVSDERVDKATAPIFAYDGRAYFFASESNRSAFAKDPERYLSTH